ncbi:MAG TPA: HAD-IA family hydrolase [Solirubrobacteraceae bacterium]|nr:HAD-IA family hydrolase [Solirubrobacteraceae bacterium]
MSTVSDEPRARTLELAGYGAVLTDLDGTLVDSDPPMRRAWTAFADRQGLDPERVIAIARGRPSRETAAELAPDALDEPARLERAETSDTEGVTAIAGAPELLAAPLTLAIVTSCSRALAAARLAAAGLPLPRTLVCTDEIARGKPDPEPYLLGAERLGVAPADCVVLEDAPAGIASGKAAGMTVIALRTTHADADLAAADAVIDDLTALALPGAV